MYASDPVSFICIGFRMYEYVLDDHSVDALNSCFIDTWKNNCKQFIRLALPLVGKVAYLAHVAHGILLSASNESVCFWNLMFTFTLWSILAKF